MADDTYIPIKGDWNKTNIHGIVPVTVCRTTELDALRPKRRGVYDPHEPDSFIWKPPTYLAPDGKITAMVWCPQCGDWKRRDAFYKNRSRKNGLQSWCRKHDDTMNERVRAYRERQRVLMQNVTVTFVDKNEKAA